jgi:hypothetical protein
LVYTKRATQNGIPAMRRAFLRRAITLYACQAAMLRNELPLWAAAALIGGSLSVLYAVARVSHHVQAPSATVPKEKGKIINAHAVR